MGTACFGGIDVARCAAQAWLESIWRPLALLCHEHRKEACLPDAILAALTFFEATNETAQQQQSRDIPLAAAIGSFWSALASEVAYIAECIAAEWNGERTEDDPDDDQVTSPDSAHVKAIASLRRMAARLHATVADESLPEEGYDWDPIYGGARDRRSALCIGLGKIGVDTGVIVAKNVERLRLVRIASSSTTPASSTSRLSTNARSSFRRRSIVLAMKKRSSIANKERICEAPTEAGKPAETHLAAHDKQPAPRKRRPSLVYEFEDRTGNAASSPKKKAKRRNPRRSMVSDDDSA